ncbi:hypothetical protein [Cobetia sp. 4B]|nr:hypothetical protein [Cobetia sp. 4B]
MTRAEEISQVRYRKSLSPSALSSVALSIIASLNDIPALKAFW